MNDRAAESNSGETYKNEKRGQLDRKELPLFFGFFTVKFFSHLPVLIPNGPADLVGLEAPGQAETKEPAIDIAGLCLPLKPQKEKIRIFFIARYSLVTFTAPQADILFHYTFLLVLVTVHRIGPVIQVYIRSNKITGSDRPCPKHQTWL